MPRMFGWDYKKPYYYMVTLKLRTGLSPLSVLDKTAHWGIAKHPLTDALHQEIAAILHAYPAIESLSPYVIMPDHIHFLIKLSGELSLPIIVRVLMTRLTKIYCRETGYSGAVFEKEWHDLIVKRVRQLPNFRNYIRHNPFARLLRQERKSLFTCYRNLAHWRLAPTRCDGIGNLTLLHAPEIIAVRISRQIRPNTPAWKQMLAEYNAWRPGQVAIGTWWSPGEKAAYAAILAHGGAIISLSPYGFSDRWHPSGNEAQAICAAGRLLYLSPYPPTTQALPEGTPRARLLALNALALRIQDAIHTPRTMPGTASAPNPNG